MYSPHLFVKGAADNGVTEEFAHLLLGEISMLEERGIAPILSLGHLAHVVGVDYAFLRRVVMRSDPNSYRALARRKAAGGVRPIMSPNSTLLSVQRWMLRNILPAMPVHSSSYAYRRGASIKTCAEKHIGSTWMVKVDLKDFFSQILEGRIYWLFKKLGYRKLVAFEFARLCTWPVKGFGKGVKYAYPFYSQSKQGVLPQGAPTSGLLANAAVYDLDKVISDFSKAQGLVYTRYSDDIIISGSSRFIRDEAHGVLKQLKAAIRSCGLEVQLNKVRIVPPGARRVVLGLLVDESVRLLPETRKQIEKHLFGCKKFGLKGHAEHRNFRSVFSLVNYLDGWCSFVSHIDSGLADKWRGELVDLLRKEGAADIGP